MRIACASAGCDQDATHRCDYHLIDDYIYHCSKHLCPHCEALNASTH